MQQISVARLFDGQNWQQNVTLTIEAGHIDSIQPAAGHGTAGPAGAGFYRCAGERWWWRFV